MHLSGYTLLNRATRDVALAALDRAGGGRRHAQPRPGVGRARCGPTCPSSSTCSPGSTSCSRTRTRQRCSPSQEDPHDALEVLADHVATVVVKVGARGVLARDPAGTVAVPALRHDVVDTTGAG